MAFFVLGSSYWGWLYALGAAFFALALVMVADLRWAVLEFGGMWTVALCLVGLRPRRLGQEPRANSRGQRVSSSEAG